MPDYTALKSAINADPALSGASDADVAAALNAQSVTVRASRMITKTTLYKAVNFDAGLAIVGGLNQMAASTDAAASLKGKEILDLIRVDGDGIDISLDETRAVIDQLAASGLMTGETAATIKALGETTTSRAQQIPGWSVPVTDIDVAHARSLS